MQQLANRLAGLHLAAADKLPDNLVLIDSLYGGADNDTLYGSRNADSLNGDGGNDTIYHSAGNDFVFGGEDDFAAMNYLACTIDLSLHAFEGLRVYPSYVKLETYEKLDTIKDLADPVPHVRLRTPGPVPRVTLVWEHP